MVTRSNIIHFYEKYEKNLKTEEQVIGEVMEAQDQEAWVENLRKKSKILRRLYIENEALLNLYLRPFLEAESRLNDELADEFLKQIRKAQAEGYEDELALDEVSQMLEHYFEHNGDLNSYIWAVNLNGGFCNLSSLPEDGERGAGEFQKLIDLKDRYFEIEDFDVRRRIIYAFYNHLVVLTNFQLIGDEERIRFLDEAIAFYKDERVRRLDGDKFDFQELIDELNYDVLGNYILATDRENGSRELFLRGKEVLGEIYQKNLEKYPEPYEMPDEVYANYKKCLFYLGEISCTEFVEDYKGLCDYILEHDTLDGQEGVEFYDSRVFQVAVNHFSCILECLKKYRNEYHGDPEVWDDCVKKYLDVIRQLPRSGCMGFVNDVVSRSMRDFLSLISDDEENSRVLMNVMVSRDETILVHSAMVNQTARRILRAVLEQAPELLVGSLGCQSVVEVLENQEKIGDFVSQSAQIFDVGKIEMAQVVNKQSRQLTAREQKWIYYHPVGGAKLIEKVPSLSCYRDVILGHHKSWDGKMGYPADFDNTASKDRFLIELIHISDCLDAATDFVGRSYKNGKKFSQCMEELSQGKGTLYCPELVELIENDRVLQEDLSYLLKAGRIRTCYEIYGNVVDYRETKETSGKFTDEEGWRQKEDTETDEKENLLDMLHESGSESRQLVRAFGRTSLLILYVDMLSGDYKVSYKSSQRLFNDLPDGQYQNLLKQYFEPAAEPEDWAKLCYRMRLSELSRTFVAEGGTYECELRLKIGGEYRWIRLQFVQIDEVNAIPRMMAVIAKDIQESHSRSEQMMAAMKEAYRAMEEANKAKSLFLSSMSHDIRTPMNGIIGMTQIAMKYRDDPDKVQDCLEKIDESSKHLLGLINEVLDMSKIESGNTELHNEKTDLIKILEGVADMCRPTVQEKEQKFVLEIQKMKNACVYVDPVRLRQVLINLVSNAVKYTPEKGCVEVFAQQVECTRKGIGTYRIVVKDNGIGMSEEFQKKLFEPFCREDNSMTNVTQGTGLGLSIAKSILTIMGGSIEVDSVQGRGTTFTVMLQLQLAKTDGEEKGNSGNVQNADTEAKEADSSDRSERVWFDGHRILLAEDNELNREIAYELLTETGLIVDTVKDGQEAVEALEKHPALYELVFMDIQMPRMNGYEAARTIRTLPAEWLRKIPIIAMTANVFQEDLEKAIDSGMNGHVTKPIDMNAVCEVLKKWLFRHDS